MCISYLSHEIQSIDFEAFLNDHHASQNLNFSLPESYFPVEIRGSCRGFILLYGRPNIYIWNPSTGFKKQMPMSPFDSKLAAHCHRFGYDQSYRLHIHGFDYDQSRDDYLVVSLSYDPMVADAVSTNVEFFSFKDNTWKEIEDTHFRYDVNHSRRKGSLFNGAIHWMALSHDLGWSVIVAFDLMERKLFEMPLPSEFDYVINSSLWVYGEFLSRWAMGMLMIQLKYG